MHFKIEILAKGNIINSVGLLIKTDISKSIQYRKEIKPTFIGFYARLW